MTKHWPSCQVTWPAILLTLTLPPIFIASPMSKTSAENDDALLWRNSLCINPTEELPCPWLFDYVRSTLVILHQPNPTEIQLSKLILVFCALLDLHTSYWNTDSPDISEIEQHCQLTVYHHRLKSYVQKDLLRQHQEKPDAVQIPEMMSPWIQRTIMLYPHDDQGREAYENHNCHVLPRNLEGRIR